MVCPFCNTQDTAVVDSRKNVDGDAIRRRRECSACNTRFTTYEKSEIDLIVKKRNGNLEEFQYEKLFDGVENAFGGQELSDKKLKNLVETIYLELKKHGKKIESNIIIGYSNLLSLFSIIKFLDEFNTKKEDNKIKILK